MTVRILSLDGGSRGLLMCLMLARLEKARPGLLDSVDVFAGTSAGSAVVSVIGVADTPQEGVEHAIKVFRHWNPFEGVQPLSPRVLMGLAGMGAFLTHEPLRRELLAILGETRMNEAKRQIVIPSVELDNRQPSRERRQWSIQTYHNLVEQAAGTARLIDVVLRSSSVPMLHPVYQGHVDGGLFANNPAMNAVIVAHDFMSATLSDVRVLSVGQGEANHYMSVSHGDIGYQQWLLDKDDPIAILNLVMEANRQATVYHLSRLLEGRFVQLNPILKADVQPNLGISIDEFAVQQEIIAQEADIDDVLEDLEEIGWFDSEGG